jgi:antitoxin ParD1/3/4
LARSAKRVILESEEDPMATMNISLPDDMKAFVEDEAAKKGFGTVSEYVRAIIRDVQERQAERERLDAFLIEGLDSGPATPLTKKDWERIRREGKKLIAQRKRGRK